MQNILVTGANRGIGLALTRRLLELGHRVFAGVREPAKANALRDLPSAELARLEVVGLELNSNQSVQSALGEVRSRTPELDVVVNMAGVSPHPHDARLDTVDLDTVTNTFLTNVIGPLRVAQAFAPLLRAAATPERPARLVNVSSGVASMKGKDNGIFYAYGVSKTALNMLSLTESFDLRDENVCVIALDPGWVRTDLGGPNAHLAPEESARPCADLILSLTMASSGKFLHYSGAEIAF
ncbi:MAG TPA: SDR family oxidoreductase [Polyangiaceae bacterium]|jgi:NAD(P)-dependent dehydrogenase (short-subunit alcohol dehydrogenase family)|nr:SDR family oxidoreductase [Polyangiaceae bacterium]